MLPRVKSLGIILFWSWVGNDVGFLSFSDSKCCWLDTLQSKNTKLWSFSIKFDELIYNNVNNTFTKKGQMARQPSSLLLSANIVAEPWVYFHYAIIIFDFQKSYLFSLGLICGCRQFQQLYFNIEKSWMPSQLPCSTYYAFFQ